MTQKRTRNWCFTVNNPEENEELAYKEWEDLRYIVFQRERGANNTVHIQGYVQFKKPKRLSALKKLHKRAHWEVSRGTPKEASDYCKKADTRLEGTTFFEFGTMSEGSGQRTDLLQVQERIKKGANMNEIAEEFFKEWVKYNKSFEKYALMIQPRRTWKTEVYYLYGKPGSGKTWFVNETSKEAFFKPANEWWDGYDGISDVVLDDFYGWLKWKTLLEIMDRYKCSVEVKGSTINFAAKRLFITSNTLPEKLYRFIVEGKQNPKIKFEAFARRVDHWIYTWKEEGIATGYKRRDFGAGMKGYKLFKEAIKDLIEEEEQYVDNDSFYQ
jgi:hypothetical protein